MIFKKMALAILGSTVLFTGCVDEGETLSEEEIGTESQEIFGRVSFDVSEDATKFVFDDAPLAANGYPAYGNSFVSQGYIYPAGTLNADGSNGTNADGSAEFPELVEGTWTCRGWFIGEGANTLTGAWVVTHQLYDFGENGKQTFTSDGIELADVGVIANRAITGGTGRYRWVGGQVKQTLKGFNASGGVSISYKTGY